MENKNFALGKSNYIVIGIAFLLVVIGFEPMPGSSSTMEVFDPSMFRFRRIVAAPNICFAGYILMIVGIMIKGKKKD